MEVIRCEVPLAPSGSAPDRTTHHPSDCAARAHQPIGLREVLGGGVSRRGMVKLLVVGAVAGLAAPVALATPVAAFQQPNWRWCHRCQVLWFAGHDTAGSCPAGGGHAKRGSGNYVLF